MSGLRVMVVDDSLLTSQKLSAMLKDLGHSVIKTCRNGMEAIGAYPELTPDLVTMDITMPDLDGISATKKILEIAPHANIIMVTSHGQEQMVLDALNAGAKGYVLKPIKLDKLDATIQQIMVGKAI